MSANFLTSFFFLLLASCAGIQNNTHNSADKHSETSLQKINNEDWLNVKDFGATGNGFTDDSKAINKAINFLSKSKKYSLFFPKGTYLIKSTIRLKGNKLKIIGASPEKTIFKGKDVYNLLLTTGVIKDSLIVKNIQFKGEEVKSTVLKVLGKSLKGKLVVEHCVFYNAHLYNIWLEGIQNARIADNVYRGLGNGRGTGIQIIDGCRNIDIINNDFYFLYRGVYIVGYNYNKDKTLTPNKNISFIDNYLDFGWYLLPTRYEGQGMKVRYSKNSIYEPNANFAKISPKDNVRLLKPLASGNLDKTTLTSIADYQTNFISRGIKKGDLIRVGNKQAIVDSVLSNHTLQIEKWLSTENLNPKSPPHKGSSYAVYRLILGKIKRNTSKKITVFKFYDFFGSTYTPKKGWKYEVLNNKPNYPFFASKNNEGFLIKNNVFNRGWADQIAVYGNNAVIASNKIMDGQDMGITVHGNDHHIKNNTIIHQRTGVWLASRKTIFENNTLIDCSWSSDYNDASQAYLYIRKQDNTVLNNVFKSEGKKSKDALIRFKKGKLLKGKVGGNKFINLKNN